MTLEETRDSLKKKSLNRFRTAMGLHALDIIVVCHAKPVFCDAANAISHSLAKVSRVMFCPNPVASG